MTYSDRHMQLVLGISLALDRANAGADEGRLALLDVIISSLVGDALDAGERPQDVVPSRVMALIADARDQWGGALDVPRNIN